MAIAYFCASCHTSMNVHNDLAGRKVKCLKCGELTRVPDVEDEEVPPARARRHREEEDDEDDRPRRRSRGKRSKRPAAGWRKPALLAGIGAAAALVLGLGLWAFLRAPSAQWSPDPALAAELGPEVLLDGFALRLPRGFQETAANQRIPGEQLRRWRGPAGEITVFIRQHPDFATVNAPTICTDNNGLVVQQTADPVYVLPGARIDRGRIDDLPFTRARYDRSKQSIHIGPSSGPKNYVGLYVAYVGDARIELIAGCREDYDSQTFRLLETSLRSFHKSK
jgi:hypothetical protein